MSNKIFNDMHLEAKNLLDDIETGRLGLPDMQRPFVWKDSKVRDLLDSMYHGWPVGYIMIWEAPKTYNGKDTIGLNDKNFHEPVDLIIDGQQRLTALLAVVKGLQVLDKDFKKREIKIAFNPIKESFEVCSNAHEKDPEFIPSVYALLSKSKGSITYACQWFYERANAGRNKKGKPLLTQNERMHIEDSIMKLMALSSYQLPILRIDATASEEAVAEIFVRVNATGTKLTENDFIETLLSVYDNDLRKEILSFCESSRIPQDGTAYNRIIALDPVHLIRMGVGVAFDRGRLKYAYQLMRGKVLTERNGAPHEEVRAENLAAFRKAIGNITDINIWHTFLHIVENAGYMDTSLIAGENTVVYSYVLYLKGKFTYHVPEAQLRSIIAAWMFTAALTTMYSSSFEATIEQQLNYIHNLKTAEEYITYLKSEMGARLTDDFFNVTLPNQLETSSVQSPYWRAFVASQIVLETPVLFETSLVEKYFIDGARGVTSPIEKHHLFPDDYLIKQGYVNPTQRRQMANFAFITDIKNKLISNKAPAEYIRDIESSFSQEEYIRHLDNHAIPHGFETMTYEDFLAARRLLMAQVIRKAYDKLMRAVE